MVTLIPPGCGLIPFMENEARWVYPYESRQGLAGADWARTWFTHGPGRKAVLGAGLTPVNEQLPAEGGRRWCLIRKGKEVMMSLGTWASGLHRLSWQQQPFWGEESWNPLLIEDTSWSEVLGLDSSIQREGGGGWGCAGPAPWQAEAENRPAREALLGLGVGQTW